MEIVTKGPSGDYAVSSFVGADLAIVRGSGGFTVDDQGALVVLDSDGRPTAAYARGAWGGILCIDAPKEGQE